MNKNFKQQIDKTTKIVESRTQSEKIVVLAMLVAGLVLAYLSLAFDPLRADIASAEGQINRINRQIQTQYYSYVKSHILQG